MSCKTILKSTALAAVIGTASAFSAQAVFFHIGSGSIDGSLCVGNDCVSSETFSFDTIRLKENNLRIKFMDTSSTASFPNNDWELAANESANGGENYFAIRDCGSGNTTGQCSTVAFAVEAGAGNNALYVDSQGDVGVGTAAPALDVTIVTGNTPSLRLQQDGSSGFAPQTWDVAGNEAGFFIRDATNGSTLPFRIIPGASSNSLVIDDDNDIGMGAGTNPDSPLHVERNQSGFLQMVHLENSNGSAGGVAYRMTNGTLSIDTNNIGGEYRINFDDGDGPELVMDADGNVEIDGEITTSGSCSIGCDRVFDETYRRPSIEEHAALMWENGYLPNVGPTPEGRRINLSDKLGRVLNELEHAHIYIDQLNAELKRQSAELDALKAQIAAR